MSKKYRRYFLKTKDAKALLSKASEKLKFDLAKLFGAKVGMELIESHFGEIILIDGKPALIKIGENIYPTLIFKEAFNSTPKVVVDMGAVPHICNGADVMAPGIVRFEQDFKKGDLVFVVDEKHCKPIALGETLYNADTAKKAKQGVIVKNIHFVGDEVWNFIKELTAKST
ncbi:MAG: RNA-binding protein [Candidatus Bathyarchaeia archaeon]